MKKIIFINNRHGGAYGSFRSFRASKAWVYKTVIAALGLAIALPLIAADTGQINYQARLLDSYGRRVNDTVDLSFKIYDAVTAGNLLWSETQADIVVQDGVYSIVLGSQTPIPASVFAQNNVYLELGINGETMSPRQQITASAYALVARTIIGSNIYENQTSGYVGVGTTNPAVKLDVSGTVQSTGFKMPTGATANYVLASDADGVGTWQPYSAVVTEHDPIHTNWVRVVYTPATNSLWIALGAEATTRGNADTVLQGNIDTASNALSTAISNEATTRANADTVLQGNIDTASNALNTAVGLRMFRSGDVMTGPLTNNILFAGNFAGNGAGLTNIPSSGISLTGVVHKAGDTMTGGLIISNDLTVSGRATWQPGGQTIIANTTTVLVNQVYAKIGTDNNNYDLIDCTKQIVPGVPGQLLIIQATNGWIKLNNGNGVTLASGVSFSMSTNDTIQLVYDGSTWVEIQRADNRP